MGAGRGSAGVGTLLSSSFESGTRLPLASISARWSRSDCFLGALVDSLPAKAMQHPVMECLRPYCTSNLFHALCVGSVALASSAFHGAQIAIQTFLPAPPHFIPGGVLVVPLWLAEGQSLLRSFSRVEGSERIPPRWCEIPPRNAEIQRRCILSPCLGDRVRSSWTDLSTVVARALKPYSDLCMRVCSGLAASAPTQKHPDARSRCAGHVCCRSRLPLWSLSF